MLREVAAKYAPLAGGAIYFKSCLVPLEDITHYGQPQSSTFTIALVVNLVEALG